MAIKRVELEKALRGEGCLGKADDSEPVFILRAQDPFAAEVVEYWARLAELGGTRLAKTMEARMLASGMRAWPHRKVPD